MNKRGIAPIIILFGVLFLILLIAFVGTVALAVIKWGSEQIEPVASNLGTFEGINGGTVNISQAGKLSFGTLNTLIGVMPLITGLGYFILLAGCIILVVSYRYTANPLYLGLFLAFMVLLVLTSILISNAYQDLYEGTDEIAQELQGMTLNSFLILNSPVIFTAIGFISGIFLFSGKQGENYQQYGY